MGRTDCFACGSCGCPLANHLRIGFGKLAFSQLSRSLLHICSLIKLILILRIIIILKYRII
jgi:hypothetical protein